MGQVRGNDADAGIASRRAGGLMDLNGKLVRGWGARRKFQLDSSRESPPLRRIVKSD